MPIGAAFVALCVCVSCDGKAAGDDDSLARVQKKGELVVYTNASWPPYEFMEGNKVVGVEVEVAKALAASMGVKLRITNADFDGFPIALANGQADVGLSTITVTPERAETLDFSIPFASSFNEIYKPKANTTIKCLNDLAGKNIGAQLGTTGDLLVEKYIRNGTLAGARDRQFKTVQDASLALARGDIDAIVGDQCVLDVMAIQNPDYQAIPAALSDGTVEQEQYAAAFKKGSTTLVAQTNKVISQLKREGKIQAWYTQYAAKAAGIAEGAKP